MATEQKKLLSDAVYENALNAAENGSKPTYAGTYETQLSDIFDRIQNREKFEYDVNADPLYQAAKDQYIQGGKLAMKDTIGQTSALTGGYGSTYTQQAGQQAYDAYLKDLTSIIPDYYGMAYSQYQDEGDRLNDLYGLIGQQRDIEYNRYRDELGDYERNMERALENERYEREWGRQAEQEEYNRQQIADQIARELEQQEYNRRIYDEERAYSRETDAYNRQREAEQTAYNRMQAAYDNLVNAITTSGYSPSDQELANAGMSRAQAQALKTAYDQALAMAQAARTAGSSGGGGGGGGGGTRTYGSAPGGGEWVVESVRMPESTPTTYQDAYNFAGWVIQNGGDYRDINNIASQYGFSNQELRNAQQAYQAQTQGGTYRGIVASSTVPAGKNMGGTPPAQQQQTVQQKKKGNGGR